MRRWSTFALFFSGLFFGGGVDHVIFIAMRSPTSHYGFRIGTIGQLLFATLDFALSTVLWVYYVRASRSVS